MGLRSQNFEKFQKQVLEALETNNKKLEKICALLVSNQLLLECISPEGTPRTAQECAEIVTESFCAGMCLSEELSDRGREFDYQKSEFFIDEEEEDEEYEEEDDEDDDNQNPFNSNHPSMTF